MSVNLNGRRVPFDPNILRPKYINNAGKFSTLEGYRPIVTSLYFPDTGVTANPDVLGIVRAGSILQSVDEVLTLATQYNSSQFTVVNSTIKDTQPMLQQAGSLLGSTTLNVTNIPQQSNQSQQLSQRSTKVWQTKYADILTGFRGISVTAKWSSGNASTEVVIDPTKTYDQLNRLQTLNNSIKTYTYTYDNTNNILSDNNKNYSYDQLYRLTQTTNTNNETLENFTYDSM